MEYPRIVRVGHRGAAGHAPENTLAAIEAGISLGVDYGELDIQRTHDGKLVVMHDKFVDRTTNGQGLVSELTWKELRRLDAGEGQKIPSLDEVLATADGRTGLMLECITPGLGVSILRAVKSTKFSSPVIYSSFLHAEVLAIHQADPSAATMALMECVPISGAAFAMDAKAKFAGLSFDSATPEFVAALHQSGIQVFFYTVDDPRLIARAIKLGADGIVTDFPERIPEASLEQSTGHSALT